MRLVLVEAAAFARRLARRRLVIVTLALDAGVLVWAAFVAPVESVRAALASAHGLGALTTLVLASGCVADDRESGRLALCATHPAPRASWVAGRWLAVTAGAGAVTVASAVAIAAAGPGLGPSGFALGTLSAVLHVAALAALAVAISCAAGATAQVLVLLALLVVGFLPPEVVSQALAAWTAPLCGAAWALLPTPWALDRLQGWALALEPPSPLLALALVAQPPFWLLAGSRALRRAERGARGGGGGGGA